MTITTAKENEITEETDGRSKPSEITITKDVKQKSVHHKIIQAPRRGNRCRMEKMESVSQSVFLSISFWAELSPNDRKGQEESRCDLVVIGLQGVISRPELKQHLR